MVVVVGNAPGGNGQGGREWKGGEEEEEKVNGLYDLELAIAAANG